MDKYEFTYMARKEVEADSPAQAFEKFLEAMPDAEGDLKHVSVGGVRLGYAYSDITDEKIYYVPGCWCGENDCIHDPMIQVAKKCRTQADMTAGKWKSCSREEGQEECFDYDDECK